MSIWLIYEKLFVYPFAATGSELSAKRVTSEASYERSEYKSAGGKGGGAVSPPGKFFEFRIPESESEHNLTNYFIIFFVTFFIKNIWENIFMIIDLISLRYLKIIMKQSTIFVNPIHKK